MKLSQMLDLSVESIQQQSDAGKTLYIAMLNIIATESHKLFISHPVVGSSWLSKENSYHSSRPLLYCNDVNIAQIMDEHHQLLEILKNSMISGDLTLALQCDGFVLLMLIDRIAYALVEERTQSDCVIEFLYDEATACRARFIVESYAEAR